jgi:alanine-glyoxylate transaminase/(R)-3-amino-2-methylpropionate-pyruvate transaminase
MQKKLQQLFYTQVSNAFSTHKVLPYTGKSYEQLREDRKYIFPFYGHHYYKDPLLIVQGFKEYLYDHTGKQYIDLVGGISCVNIGHSHPRLA